LKVGGALTVRPGKGGRITYVSLFTADDLAVNRAEAENQITIIGPGNIVAATPNAQNPVLISKKLSIHSLGQKVGKQIDPLYISADLIDASGVEVHIRNNKTLKAGLIIGDLVTLNVNGDLLSDGVHTPNIISKSLVLSVKGNIGKPGSRLVTDTNRISTDSYNLYLHNESAALEVNQIKAGTAGRMPTGIADIITDGRITGKIIFAKDLFINAGKGVGGQDPLLIYVPGIVNIASQNGYNWWVNLYRRPVTPPFGPTFGSTSGQAKKRVAGEGVLGVEDWGDIVTDKNWVNRKYEANIYTIRGKNVFRVMAFANEETGAFELRYLLLRPWLIAQLAAMGVEELWFELEDASLRIPLSVLTSAATREAMERCGFNIDTDVFVLMIEPHPEGQEIGEGGKTYNVGIYIRHDDVQEYVMVELTDIGEDLDNPIRLVPREDLPVEWVLAAA